LGVGALTPPSEALPRATPGRGADGNVSGLTPGALVAGRYRMVTRIGRGGMGEVWQADDLTLNTAVALKFVYSATPEDRERILKEVRLARRITDPAVCRVFDIGEADGRVFYSMELIEGEDLAALLRHAGRLPSEKVIDIGHQLCAGLAAAHAQGVLHRDLKPGNVLIDDAGVVRITDFGIAVARKDANAHAGVGTPAYMSPEQIVSDGQLSERTDIYALGLILYELAVGQRPFADSARPPGPPRRPSALVGDMDRRLERAIMLALAASPDARPRSTAALAATLAAPALGQRVPDRLRPWLGAAALAALVLVAAVVASRLVPRPMVALTDRDTIVLSDFVNTTSEPVFDGALKVALAVALEQSAFLKVFPESGVRETLRLMQRAPDERLTREVAREVARRERLRALVAGSIAKLGSHYVLGLEAVNVETGDVMARAQVEATGTEDVLTALGQATSQLRERLGESLASIQRFDAPLARATTSSLDALHAYSLALDEGRLVPRLEAIPHVQRALELDPDFAMAHALLASIYRNTGRSTEAAAIAQRAFDLRDRVSERERYFISWRYYMDAVQAWDKALELSASWTKTYPREPFAFNSLGLAAGAFGQHERAVDAFREAIRLDPRFSPPYGNLVGSLIALNRLDEGQKALDEASRQTLRFIGLRRHGYVLGFIRHDADVMARELDAAGAMPEGVWSANWEARDALFAGQFKRAHDLFAQSVQQAIRENYPEYAAQWTMEDAEAHALAGQCETALREVAAGLSLRRDNFTLERAGRTLALCGAETRTADVVGELARRFPMATLTARIQRPVIAAALALQRGRAAAALTELDPVRPYDHTPASEFWPAYLRGLAHLRLKNGRAAGAEFKAIIDHRGEAPTSPLYALAELGLGRAVAASGDAAGARRHYDAFFSLWQAADQNITIVQDAQAEYTRLQ
jgi:serine/threonine protein kinase/tetratricopeptide (TPR) repeat protein